MLLLDPASSVVEEEEGLPKPNDVAVGTPDTTGVDPGTLGTDVAEVGIEVDDCVDEPSLLVIVGRWKPGKGDMVGMPGKLGMGPIAPGCIPG